MAKSYFSYLMKNLNSQTQTQTHNTQTAQIQDNEKVLQVVRKRMSHIIQGKMKTLMSDFSTEIRGQQALDEIFNVLIVKENIKLSSVTDKIDMKSSCMWKIITNQKPSLLEQINKFRKVADYKINIPNPSAFLHISKINLIMNFRKSTENYGNRTIDDRI